MIFVGSKQVVLFWTFAASLQIKGVVEAWTASTRHHHATAAQSRLFASPNGIFASSEPEKLILQTDYLKNPRPVEENAPEPAQEKPTTTVSKLRNLDECTALLEQSLLSFNSVSAKELLEEFDALRKLPNGQEIITIFLGNLLNKGPDSSRLPLWSKIRNLARYSRRARWASLRRALDATTPPPNTEDVEQDTAEDELRGRRRALLTILRALASDGVDNAGARKATPAIVVLEKKARKEIKAARKFSGEDLTLRRPSDLETPTYTVIDKKSFDFEIRQYQDFAVCSVAMNKPRPVDSSKTDVKVMDPSKGGARAFGALAGYLFGKNEEEQAMKMTTPVITTGAITESESLGEKEMSFVLPSEYWKDESVLSTAPTPLQGSGVTLKRFQGSNRAVRMFGGYASKQTTEEQSARLLAQLEKDSEWKVADGETVTLAQYNDPFTPPWKRLNEVSIAVVSK